MKFRKIFLLAFGLVVASSFLVGCKQKHVQMNYVFGSQVYYNKEGNYETTIKNVQVNNLKTNDVKIVYNDFVSYNNDSILGQGNVGTGFGLQEVEGTVKKVKVNDDKSVNISFTGVSNKTFPTDAFYVEISKAKTVAKDILIEINVKALEVQT